MAKKSIHEWRIIVLAISVILATFLYGCVQQKPEKVPVIEVNFSHYVISGQHIVKINSAKRAEVEIEKVRVTNSPPFPGIHVYAIYNKSGRIVITPVAPVSINTVGDNITAYIGMEKKDVPESGTNIVVVVEVWDANSRKLAGDRVGITW
ncbi:hypothetical protein [Geoglobus acetivorans]|uniref:Uncharacterized protein n=1 Tax=Geoglobus acetivorans TaxID=565033 RepID=A0A0A7GGD3_GEOAI|nr:hypothetical protein GACE_1842 [Geoglobus acetivorans]